VRVVVLHDLRVNSRHTQVQYLQSFAKFNPGLDVVYANVFGCIDQTLSEADLVILFYDFLSLRNAPFWKAIVNRVSPVIVSAKRKVMIPQDDYTSCIELDRFTQEFKVDAVYSGIVDDLEVLYPNSTASGVRFEHAFAGYAPDANDTSFVTNSVPYEQRIVDLGQRIRHLPPQFIGFSSNVACCSYPRTTGRLSTNNDTER